MLNRKKMKAVTKIKNPERKKMLLCFICGALVFGTIGVGATTLLYSKDITYDNSSSGLSSTTVQDALDELYEKAKNAGGCPEGFVCISPSIQELTKNVVTSGDGLYSDSVTSGRYFYRGTTVNNYITFNNETWRIISVESDGTLKIIRNEQLSSTQSWDAVGNRDSLTSTYCINASSEGCNAWAATSNLVGKPSTFIQYYPNGDTSGTAYSGTVTKDALLNTYLNEGYYNSLSREAQTKVVTGTFNVSTPGNINDIETLEVDAEQEKQYQWQGYVALMNVTELLRASTSSGCTSLKLAYSSSTNTCDDNNWLWPTFNISAVEWTLSPHVNSVAQSVWVLVSNGSVGVDPTLGSITLGTPGVRPALHLSSDITLSGSGTQSDPYTIN